MESRVDEARSLPTDQENLVLVPREVVFELEEIFEDIERNDTNEPLETLLFSLFSAFPYRNFSVSLSCGSMDAK